MKYPFYAIIILSPLFYHMLDLRFLNPFLFGFVSLLLLISFIIYEISLRHPFYARYLFYVIIILTPLFYYMVDPGAIDPNLFGFVSLFLLISFIFVSIIERNLFIIAIVIALFWITMLLVALSHFGWPTRIIGDEILFAAIHLFIQIAVTYLVLLLYRKLRKLKTKNKETVPN